MSLHTISLYGICLFIICAWSRNGHAQSDSTIAIPQNNWQRYYDAQRYTEAVQQAQQTFSFAKRTNNQELMAYALYWMGESFRAQNKKLAVNRRNARRAYTESLRLLQTINNNELKLDNLRALKDLSTLDGNQRMVAVLNNQIRSLEERLEIAASNEVLNAKVELLDSAKLNLEAQLQSLTDAQMQAELMLAKQKNLLDSIEMVRMKEAFELEKQDMNLKDQANQIEMQQQQLDLQASQRNLFIAVAVIMALIAIGGILRYVETRKYNQTLKVNNTALAVEQKKSNDLLLNILPVSVAEELKNTGIAKANRYEMASVMFSDFKDFSSIAKVLSPEKLVAELDLYFKRYDDIISKYGIEKIKTIGDAYMCVGGLNGTAEEGARQVILAALEIQELLEELKQERLEREEPFFEARIGVHSGPLVAGVVGSIKFAYDIWGDTVNVASRMETNGEPWRVNISAVTQELIKSEFSFEYRGIIPIKNRGEIAMYFVSGALEPVG